MENIPLTLMNAIRRWPLMASAVQTLCPHNNNARLIAPSFILLPPIALASPFAWQTTMRSRLA